MEKDCKPAEKGRSWPKSLYENQTPPPETQDPEYRTHSYPPAEQPLMYVPFPVRTGITGYRQVPFVPGSGGKTKRFFTQGSSAVHIRFTFGFVLCALIR
jgi:hypothetical protein